MPTAPCGLDICGFSWLKAEPDISAILINPTSAFLVNDRFFIVSFLKVNEFRYIQSVLLLLKIESNNLKISELLLHSSCCLPSLND